MTLQKRFAQILALALIFAGCKTSKIVTALPIDRSDSEIYEALVAHNYDFTWFAGEANISVDSPQQSISGKTYVRIRKDSVLWSVVKKSGVEGGRLLVTPEMYAAINRLDGTYTRGQSSEVLTAMGISLDFYDIQQAIFGNIIIPEEGQYTISKISSLQYAVKSSSGEFDLTYNVDAGPLTISSIEMKTANGRLIRIAMAEYKMVSDKINFAHKRAYTIVDPLSGTTDIALHYKKTEVDIPKSLKFSIPPHYEEIK